MLVATKADPNPAPDGYGDTPLSNAKKNGSDNIAELVVRAGARNRHRGCTGAVCFEYGEGHRFVY